MKLNIGCGKTKKAGYINLDVLAAVEPDVVCDIRRGLPFDDNYFAEITADYVLEQIRDNDEFVYVLNEIWRILRPGGEFVLKVPNAEHAEAFRDPMDCRYFTPDSFSHFAYDHYRYKAFDYGFRPWRIIDVSPEKETRIKVIMTPYK